MLFTLLVNKQCLSPPSHPVVLRLRLCFPLANSGRFLYNDGTKPVPDMQEVLPSACLYPARSIFLNYIGGF